MLTGRIKSIVHLSRLNHLRSARIVPDLLPDYGDLGFGIIEDEERRDVYFSQEAAESGNAFDDLRRGQSVVYALYDAPRLRACSIRLGELSGGGQSSEA